MRRIQIITVVALILAALVFAYSQAPQTRSRTGQTAIEAKRDKPLKARKVLVKELPKSLNGLELKDGMFRLKPGYKFVPKTKNTMLVAMNDGSPAGSVTCSCLCFYAGNMRPSGGCIVERLEGDFGTVLQCRKDPWDKCESDDELDCGSACMGSTMVSGKSVGLAIF